LPRLALAARRLEPSFFEIQAFAVNELPHRPVINLEAPLSQLADKSSQGELSLRHPLHAPQANPARLP
jgi:hypothetical protein